MANQKDQNETKINDNFCRITIDDHDHSVGKFVYRYTTSSFTQSRTTILIYSKNGGRSIFETKMMKILNTKDVLPVYRTSQYFQQHRKQTSYDNHDVRFFCIFLKDLGTKKNTLTIDYNKGSSFLLKTNSTRDSCPYNIYIFIYSYRPNRQGSE